MFFWIRVKKFVEKMLKMFYIFHSFACRWFNNGFKSSCNNKKNNLRISKTGVAIIIRRHRVSLQLKSQPPKKKKKNQQQTHKTPSKTNPLQNPKFASITKENNNFSVIESFRALKKKTNTCCWLYTVPTDGDGGDDAEI